MKMMYNGTQIKSLNVKHYEMDTNDCDMIASDLQAGKTAVARGKKITGTGKSFEFARYGAFETNLPMIVPNIINVVEIASTTHPIKTKTPLNELRNVDFSTPQIIGSVVIETNEYPITAVVDGMFLTFSCDKTVTLQIFYGKDNYV